MRGVVRWCVGGALVLGLEAGAAAAQTRPEVRALPTPPESAIYIGNSFFYYNNSMRSHVRGLMRGMGLPPPSQVSVTISGSGFDWHDVASYFRPNAVGSYTFDDDNNIVFSRRDRLFDVAVLMDCSQCPVHPRLSRVFTEYARRHAETVRANGAQPVFFMSWAYADKPEMTAQLAEAYTAAGNANGALVIPAGLAFARPVAERPSLGLYAADKRHPSLAGTFLAAATTMAALTGRSPEPSAYTAGLDDGTAAFLRGVAWRTVQDYLGTGRTTN
jgi:hypothetical protein